MPKVLVTGASGMLGTALVGRLAATKEVWGVSRSGREGAVRCDLADPRQVRELFARRRPDVVIHAAAYSDVDGCERDPKRAHESNALATDHLARCCDSARIPLIYVSTDYVFDGRKKTRYVENDPTGPVNVYGMTKLEGEFFVRQTAGPSVIVRTSWLFGPGNPDSFVNAIVRRLKEEKVVPVLDDQEDSPTYVKDLAEALERIADSLIGGRPSADKQPHRVFHVCNLGSTTRYRMTLKIKEYLGLGSVRVEKTESAGIRNRLAIRPAYGVMSSNAYEKFFGVKLRSWEDSLREYLCGRA